MKYRFPVRMLPGTIIVLLLAGCSPGPSFEYIHLPGTEPAAGANMPFTSAIRVASGNIVFLSGLRPRRFRTAILTYPRSSITWTSALRLKPRPSWRGCRGR